MKNLLKTLLIATSLLCTALLQRGVAQTSDNSISFDIADAESASIDVLWYGQNPTYNSKISELAAAANSHDPWGDGNLDWNLSFWNPEDTAPTFSDYDVFVIGAGVTTGPFTFDPNGIFNNKSAIEAARGSRTFLSGQDADSHYSFNNTASNGAFGFLANAVNWAGSGTGMGIVALSDGWYPQSNPINRRWWLNENSFLKNELEGYVSYFLEQNVVIPTETSDFPVNEGLTTAGLSNWNTSAHAGFNKNIPGYLSINK